MYTYHNYIHTYGPCLDMCWVYSPCVLGPQRQYLCCASDCCVSPPSYLIREPNFRLCIFDYSDRRQHSALLTSALRWGTLLAFSNLEILLECKREQNKRYLQEIKMGGSKVVFLHCGRHPHPSAQPLTGVSQKFHSPELEVREREQREASGRHHVWHHFPDKYEKFSW